MTQSHSLFTEDSTALAMTQSFQDLFETPECPVSDLKAYLLTIQQHCLEHDIALNRLWVHDHSSIGTMARYQNKSVPLIHYVLDRYIPPKAIFTSRIHRPEKEVKTILSVLFDLGFDIDTQNEDLGTLLHDCALHGYASMASFLIDRGADLEAMDGYGRRPLHHASEDQKIEVLQLLLQNMTHIHYQSISGTSALHVATARQQPLAVKTLLQKDASILSLTNREGLSAFHLCSITGNMAILRELLPHILSPDILDLPDPDGETAIFMAAWHNHLDFIQTLISHGANHRLCDHEGKSPLKEALTSQCDDVAHYLQALEQAELEHQALEALIPPILNPSPEEGMFSPSPMSSASYKRPKTL